MKTIIVDVTLFILLMMSVFTWTICFVKYRKFQFDQSKTNDYLLQFWELKDWKSAEQLSIQSDNDFASIARAGFGEYQEYISHPQSLKYSGDFHDVIERPIRQELQKIMRRQEKGLAELATIGSTAPFVGLFGTVWGIMHALQSITSSGQASIDVVAGPIGEALIATAIGIATALPAVLAYNFFLRRIKLQITDLENFAEDFIRLAVKNFSK